MRIPSGSTDRYIYFVAVDATDLKTRETGLSSFTVYRSRNGGVAAAFTTPTINETDVTNMPGVYELLLDEDTTLDSGHDAQEMCLHITHAGMAPVTRVIEIYRPETTEGNTLAVTAAGTGGINWGNVENQSTSVNLSATTINLCNTITTYTGNTVQTGDVYSLANGATGFTAIDTVVDAIKVKTDFLPSATAGSAGGVFIAGTNAATTITTSLTTTFTGNLTGSVGSVTGAVGSVTGAVGSVTGNVGGNVTGSVGSLATQAKADVNAEVDTALVDIGLDHLLAASVAGTDVVDNSVVAKIVSSSATADWDSYANTTDSLQAIRDRGDAAWITATSVTVSDKTGFSIAGTKTTLDALNDVSTAQVNAEVDTALVDIHLDHLLAADYDPASKPGVATALFNELIEDDGGVSRYTANALEQAPTGGGTPQTGDAYAYLVSNLGALGAAATEAGGTGDHLTALATAASQTTITTHLTDVKGTGFSKDTHSLTDILADVTGIAGSAMRGTDGASTHSAADVWTSGTRTLTAATNITSTGGTTVPQTGDSFARLGAPAGASVSADVAAVKTDTGNLVTRITSTLFTGITSLAEWLGLIAGKQTGNTTARTELRATGAGSGTYDETTDSLQAVRDRGDSAWITATSVTVSDKTGFKLASDGLDLVTAWTVNVTGNLTGNVTGSIGSLGTQAKADVNAEVLDVLSTDTFAEPTGVPGATVTLSTKIGYLYMGLRNRLDVTATKKTFYDDGGTAEWEKDLSDDGTTYSESEGNAP